ncbi:MAG TPA: response regulator [Opitutaceae bacterium]
MDDEPGVRKVVARVLERLNFNPMLAASAADALRFVEAHRSELKVIITDMNMPQMDGLAFVRAVRALLPTTPVIVASGHLEDRVAAELRTHGVTRTLSKPFPPDVLAAALRAALATQTE